MTLQQKLLGNYQAELEVVHNLQNSGVSNLESALWDFTGEHDNDSMIHISEIISELEHRISILSAECTEDQVNSLNY